MWKSNPSQCCATVRIRSGFIYPHDPTGLAQMHTSEHARAILLKLFSFRTTGIVLSFKNYRTLVKFWRLIFLFYSELKNMANLSGETLWFSLDALSVMILRIFPKLCDSVHWMFCQNLPKIQCQAGFFFTFHNDLKSWTRPCYFDISTHTNVIALALGLPLTWSDLLIFIEQ